ncbi:MAG: hypothetical protein CL928_10790 [Deltaproteobacteria bacterium]|nr:hypothetical protein [Deltaproteobacteria bacterium]
MSLFVVWAVLMSPSQLWAQDGPGPGPEGADESDQGEGPDDDDQPEPAEEKSYVIIDSPFEALERACVEDRDGEACLKAGWGWKQGTGIPKPDLFQAHDLFEAGCVFSNAASCVALGRMYLTMEAGMQLELPKGTVSLDFGAASDAFASACRLGLLQACGVWGDINTEPKSMLPNRESKVRNIKRDLVQAVQAWTLGCNEAVVPDAASIPGDPPKADTRSCVRLAEFHEKGVGGFGQSNARAADYYERACMSGDSAEYCKRAAQLRVAPQANAEMSEPETTVTDSGTGVATSNGGLTASSSSEAAPAQAEAEQPASRRTAQPRRPKPKVDRFDDPNIGIVEEKAAKPIRIEFELGLGARWTYGALGMGGIKMRAGMNLWFWLFGFGLETAFNTDKLFQVEERFYSRYMHTLSAKIALPLPFVLAIPARLYVVAGGGPTLGSLALGGEGRMLTWGAREMLQLVIVTLQSEGARQWGAVRFEQQQSWHAQTIDGPEHASQIVLIFGFTFGGWGPSFRRGEQSPPTQIPVAQRLPEVIQSIPGTSLGATGLR